MNVTWILPDGTDVSAEVSAGQTLMEAAVANGIPRILGDCGGNLSCATCHVFVDEAWLSKTGDMGDFEDAMLDATDVERCANSRLSCQIEMSAELDGLRLVVPSD